MEHQAAAGQITHTSPSPLLLPRLLFLDNNVCPAVFAEHGCDVSETADPFSPCMVVSARAWLHQNAHGQCTGDVGDPELMNLARKSRRIMVTRDSDYKILAERQGMSHAGIILLKGNLSAEEQFRA
ncbi:MAG: DUF5615 family PIN-like protein, partial [Pseudomonadota bacterium]|nr:DUF5615 family PIN-like protein [Pseudomonadota bacterium]